jgi:hypothetical protein
MKKITKISFDKNKIRNNIEKYDIETQSENWELILNK